MQKVSGLQQVRGENYTRVGLSWYMLHCYIMVALEVTLITRPMTHEFKFHGSIVWWLMT